MSLASVLDDEAIDAIVRGAHPVDVPVELHQLAAFAAEIRAAAGPPPRPSPALARIIASGGRVVEIAEADEIDEVAGGGGVDEADEAAEVDEVAQRRAERSVAPAPARHLHRRSRARVAGAGAVAKVAVGATAAVALVGVGAAAALPGEAGRAVRNAIEMVTPVNLFGEDDPGPRPPSEEDVPADPVARDGDGADTGDRPTDGSGTSAGEHGDDVSADATGESDGESGVDGGDVSETAPGADLRPPWGPGDPGWPPSAEPTPLPGQTSEGQELQGDGVQPPAAPPTGSSRDDSGERVAAEGAGQR